MNEIYKQHPSEPRSNIAKCDNYDPDKYVIGLTSGTVTTDEALTPNRPPRLTQATVGMYLKPTTRELDVVPPRPTIDELPRAVINRMLAKDKAFLIDKPGADAYTLTDAYYHFGMVTDRITPHHQSVFPRSYQYELECVKQRRLHSCDKNYEDGEPKKQLPAHCRDCSKGTAALSAFQLEWAPDPVQRRWRQYPDLTRPLTEEEIRCSMGEVGRPFRSEACNWYYENYPSKKYDTIGRKFSS
ncbi:uncharacterized protein LOC105386482 [Plutella xylostella]|uniref:uncharacterized protein LOC105386482 n=1 Tax=Plutella xylostella TaxID=51655 RepID=UPI0020326C8D|nr:uncharacterized protein LOC105386482 [Plutella xylostella]